MNLFAIIRRRGLTTSIWILVLASLVSTALALTQMAWTKKWRDVGLIWNLFLAWLPLALALLGSEQFERGAARNWRWWLCAIAWLLFFPNSPYIFTDLTHLRPGPHTYFWVALIATLLCALTGWVVGFVSLLLMQRMVARLAGRVAGWSFVAVVAGLSGFGIYIGRFLRFNSWDVVYRPKVFWRGLGGWVADPFGQPNPYVFPALYGVFIFISYLMLYGLTHLPLARRAGTVEEPGSTVMEKND